MEFKLEQRVKVTVTREMEKIIIEIVKNKNFKKSLVVIDPFFLENSKIKILLKNLKNIGNDYVILDSISSDPKIVQIDDGASIYKENNCDSIISIGGGSIIDAARGINIVQSNGGSIRDFVFERKVKKLIGGQISVPTTAGTGSELSNAVVTTDESSKQKMVVLSDEAISEFAVIDATLMVTLPKQLTIMTGLDAFAHAFEGYTSKLSSPIIDVLCEKVMFLLVKYLPRVVKDGSDIFARERVAMAAALGGIILNNSGTQIGHSIAHIIGAKFNIPHGAAVAYSTGALINLMSNSEEKKIKEVGNILGVDFKNLSPNSLGKLVSDKFLRFRDDELGLRSFEEYNLSKSEIKSCIPDILKERFINNAPIKVTDDILNDLIDNYG